MLFQSFTKDSSEPVSVLHYVTVSSAHRLQIYPVCVCAYVFSMFGKNLFLFNIKYKEDIVSDSVG